MMILVQSDHTALFCALVFVLENGGTLGTGGQPIPGDLRLCPARCHFAEADYAALSAADFARLVAELPADGVNLVIVHTHENEH